LLNAAFHRELDLAIVTPIHDDWPWLANLAILQLTLPDSLARGELQPQAVAEWLTFDITNPGSIIGCINRSRNNARSIRGTIGPHVWRAINSLYWQLRETEFASRARYSPFDYYQAVESGCHLFQGVCDATLPHDEGWEFIRLGRSLERADKTLRILTVNYEYLSQNTDAPMVALEWGRVLKSANAFEAYQRAVGRVEPDRVIEFLLMDTTCPRAVRFCLEEASRAISSIERYTDSRGHGRTERMLGRVISELRYAEPGQMIASEISYQLPQLLQQCNNVGRMVHEQYLLAN